MPSTTEQSATLLQGIKEAEASLLLEGLDPNKDDRYVALREQLIAGTVTIEEAIAAFNAHFVAAELPRPNLELE